MLYIDFVYKQKFASFLVWIARYDWRNKYIRLQQILYVIKVAQLNVSVSVCMCCTVAAGKVE